MPSSEPGTGCEMSRHGPCPHRTHGVLGGTVFRKPPNVPAVDKPQLQCPDGKCRSCGKIGGTWSRQGSGKASRRKACLN